MTAPIVIRLGGYGPPTTTHSRGLKAIGDWLEATLGDAVDVRYVWNVMDIGHRTQDLLWLTECGMLSICYMSTAALTARAPELGFADLPFLFDDLDSARAAYDGALGRRLDAATEAHFNFRVLGYFENGFRHLSNRLRPVRRPEDLAGMRIRTLNSAIHARTFEVLGAIPSSMDLNRALEVITAGGVDAQENPLANTVTYGVHRYHRFHTLSGHFYLSRGLYANRDAFDAWPAEVQAAAREAVAQAAAIQRGLAVEEEEISRRAIEAEGCEFVSLTDDERAAFRAAVAPVRDEARARFGAEMFDLVGGV